MKPLVSVIITTYGGSATIERAVRSVVSQTYDNLEVIVIDDNGVGTADQIATQKIINNAFSEKITYIAHPQNKNGSAARNTGIKAAHGKYIALLDDDDAFRPDKIEKQVRKLESSGEEYAVCYTGLLVHFSDGRKIQHSQCDEGYLFHSVVARKLQAPSSVLMFTREAALAIGGFDESFRRHQDWEFLDRMSEKYSIAVVPDVCMDRYIYRRNSAKNAKIFERNRLYYMEKMEPLLSRLPLHERNDVYDFHYQDICKAYLKEFSFRKAFQYLKLCNKPLTIMKRQIIQMIRRVKGAIALK